jgi:streptomycin 6-kinase
VIEVPEFVRRTALADGGRGAAWLDGLEQIVAELERQWEIRVGRPLPGGTEAFVAEATTAEGAEAVLKIAPPGRGGSEARVLSAAKGRGYVRLLRYSERRSALLLERLGVQLHDLGLPVDDQVEIICGTLREAWRAPTGETGLISAVEKAEQLTAVIRNGWADLGKPCSERAVETALCYAKLRAEAFDPRTAVVSHGDAHAWNTLLVPGSPRTFRLIDPDGLIAERAYDLAISMREWSAELLAGDPVALGRRRAARLAKLAGVEAEPIWQWGFLERVANGILLLQTGLNELAGEALAVVDAWAEAV